MHIKTTSAGNDPDPEHKKKNKKKLQGSNVCTMFPKVHFVTAALSRLWRARTIANLHLLTEISEGDIVSG